MGMIIVGCLFIVAVISLIFSIIMLIVASKTIGRSQVKQITIALISLFTTVAWVITYYYPINYHGNFDDFELVIKAWSLKIALYILAPGIITMLAALFIRYLTRRQLSLQSPKNHLKIVDTNEVNRRILMRDTFVVNIVTEWCPDCTERQPPHIAAFTQKMHIHGVNVLQVNMQSQKGEFISVEHEKLTSQFGGPGYPRTVLIRHGKVVDQNNVEVISEDGLTALTKKFIKIIER